MLGELFSDVVGCQQQVEGYNRHVSIRDLCWLLQLPWTREPSPTPMARLITRFAIPGCNHPWELERTKQAQLLEIEQGRLDLPVVLDLPSCCVRTPYAGTNPSPPPSPTMCYLADRVTATAPGTQDPVVDSADVEVHLKPPPSISLGECLVTWGTMVACV